MSQDGSRKKQKKQMSQDGSDFFPKFPVLEGYIIFNTKTGLYSRGGGHSDRLWGKRPKIWANIGHLKNHLYQYYYREYMDNKFLIDVAAYDENCVIYNVTSGLAWEEKPYDIILNKINREIAHSRSRGSDKEWKIQKHINFKIV